MRTLFYFISEAFRGLIGARLLTVVSVGTIGAALFFLGLCACAYLTVDSWVRSASQTSTMAVYLTEQGSDSATLSSVSTTISRFPGIYSVKAISKKAAWDRFTFMYGTVMLTAVDENPFPASIEITLGQKKRSIESIDSLAQKLRSVPLVESVSYNRTYLEKLQSIKSAFGTGIILVGSAIFGILVFMIANTVKLTIYGRKDLVVNMRYMGATGFFIRGPFVMEGVLQGFLGALVALMLLGALHIALRFFPLDWGGAMVPVLLLSVGVVSGCIGSLGALRKFLS